MANFFNPRDLRDDYDEIDLIIKPGESKLIALYGGGPNGEDLALKASKDGYLRWSKPERYAKLDHTRTFWLSAAKRGYVKLYGMYNGAPWATMEIYIAPRNLVKKSPPRIPQVQSWLCWAAAMSSFLKAAGDPKSRDELKAKYATDEASGALQPDESRARDFYRASNNGQLYDMDRDRAKTRNMQAMLKDLGLDFELRGGPSLSFDYFYKKLAAKGRLWICIDKGAYSHCLVLYGAIEAGETPSYDRVLLMDPNSASGSYEIWSMDTFSKLRQVIIAWNP